VVFANRYGMVSVLVAPLSFTRDHPVAVVLRYAKLQHLPYLSICIYISYCADCSFCVWMMILIVR
jgi:hypothetical protein